MTSFEKIIEPEQRDAALRQEMEIRCQVAIVIAAIFVWIIRVYAGIWARGMISAVTRRQVTGGWAWRYH